MTITLQAVNELIQSLESAGELSIKELKYLDLARAFKQLAAENVGLKNRTQQLIDIINNADNAYCMCGDAMKSHTHGGCGHPTGMFDYHYGKWLEHGNETPATDRIVAGIKADGLPANIAEIIDSGDLETICYESERSYAEDFRLALYNFRQLREGADK